MQSPMIEQATGASLRLRSRTTAVVGGLGLLAVVCLYAADPTRPRVHVLATDLSTQWLRKLQSGRLLWGTASLVLCIDSGSLLLYWRLTGVLFQYTCRDYFI